MLQLFLERMPSPVGEVILGTDDKGVLRVLDFADYEPRMRRLLQRQYGAKVFSLADAVKPSKAASVLGAYFDGDLTAIDRLKTANGGTAFPAQGLDGAARHSRAQHHHLWRARRPAGHAAARRGRWVLPMAPIRSPLSFPAIASSEPMAR